ncbi:hypothetical protein T492DRAFT_881894 [Pavlovales sp. CCMP2436]|nr:hypothetical protein T492DRAFT_881894 [Pavlovales sp. CCMP2436]
MIGEFVGCVLGLAMFKVALCYACVIAAVAWFRFSAYAYVAARRSAKGRLGRRPATS